MHVFVLSKKNIKQNVNIIKKKKTVALRVFHN